MATFTGINLPDIKDSDLNSEKERRKILEYLYQLTEQLRFTLSNLDEDNLSDELTDSIEGAYTAASSVSKEVKDMSGNVSSLKQFANSLTLSVTNGEASSQVALTANGVQISSGTVAFTGDIVFKSNLTDGITQISGSNIKTGTVAASRIDVDNLYVKHLSGADGTFSGSLSAASGTFTYLQGSQYINLANTMLIYPGYISTSGYISIGNTVTVDSRGLTLLGSTNSVRIFMNPPTASGGSEARWVDQGSYYSLGIYTSARKDKKDIAPIGAECSGIVDGLRPVYFHFKEDAADKNLSVGFIADETDAVCREITSYSPDGEPIGVQYSNITAIIIAELQRLRIRVKELEDKAA